MTRWRWWVVPLTLIAGLVAYARWHHPEFVIRVTDVSTPSLGDCVQWWNRHGVSGGVVDDACGARKDARWFVAAITNVGNQDGFAIHCAIRDQASTFTADLPPVVYGFPAGPHLDPGERLDVLWHLEGHDDARLRGSCQATDYGGEPPI